MGKQRKQRRKHHYSLKTAQTQTVAAKEEPKNVVHSLEEQMETQPLILTSNLFAGLDIEVDKLNKNLSDLCSVKSFKSEFGKNLPKKDKIKLRRQILMEKLDATRKRQKKTRAKNDKNMLKDTLPALQSLLQEKVDRMHEKPMPKRKGTQKASKRKKYFLKDVSLFKKLMYNDEFKANPHKVVSEHIRNIVEHSKRYN